MSYFFINGESAARHVHMKNEETAALSLSLSLFIHCAFVRGSVCVSQPIGKIIRNEKRTIVLLFSFIQIT
jgi:hypothetical protein